MTPDNPHPVRMDVLGRILCLCPHCRIEYTTTNLPDVIESVQLHQLKEAYLTLEASHKVWQKEAERLKFLLDQGNNQ